jgi:hypothetical protein
MDMKSILTTLDVLNQQKAKSADIIAEDEIEEELTLEELEALEEDDELEEATMDDWHKASGWKRTSRSQEKTPGGTLRKSTYLPQDKIDQAVEIVLDMVDNTTGAYEKIIEVFGEKLGEMLWKSEEVQAALLQANESIEEGLVGPDGKTYGVAKEKPRTKPSKSDNPEPSIENEPRKGIYGTKKFVKDDDNELSHIAKLAGLEEEGNDMVPYADPELDFEGDMAKNQLARIMMHAEHLASMLDDNENMPEWVQSKITKALDYIATAHDYLMGEEYKD